MKALVLAGLFVCHICLTLARSAGSSLNIPSDARPGHIVTILPKDLEQKTRITSLSNPSLAKYFTVMNQGALISTKSVSGLAGKTIPLQLEHSVDFAKWTEFIYIHVHNYSSSNTFQHQPYFGHIQENKPSGTPVDGLETLMQDSLTFSYGCRFSVSQTPSNKIELHYSKAGIYLESVESFDREIDNYLRYAVEAKCPNMPPVYATLHIQIVDENDNSPWFGKSVYYTALSPPYTYGTPVLTLIATDADKPDEITYRMEGHEAFSIDGKTGQITIAEPDLLQDKSYQLAVRSSDRVGHVSEAVSVEVECGPPHSGETGRHRRAIRQDRVFVVNKMYNAGSDLFTVASVPHDDDERFAFLEPRSDGLQIDQTTGMVRRGMSHVWNDSLSEETFYVNITKVSDPSCKCVLFCMPVWYIM